MKKLSLSIFVLLLIILNPISFALAHEGQDDSATHREQVKAEIEAKRQEIKANIEKRKQEAKDRIASKAAARKEKLVANKLKICEQRKDNITNRANNVAKRIEKHFNRFGIIVDKVDAFYTTKLVPKGVVVDNYDVLKADIEAQKNEVQSLLTQLKDDIAAFDCTTTNPKSQLETVKAEIKDVHLAMKDYRTAIVNFIKAIKNAVKEKKEASSSAEID